MDLQTRKLGLNIQHNLFLPGQFACDQLHVITLPLHNRVTPTNAMSTISMALQLFSVTNRSNLFVYPEENGRIFYLKLSIRSVNSKSDQPQDMEASSLILEVFGVDSPSPEITEQLQQLLRSKLAAATLLNISTLMARNPQFKLTAEDVEFIRGPTTTPLKSLVFHIPSFITPHLYFMYLKQNLLQFLRQMVCAAPSAEVDALLTNVSMGNGEIDCTFVYNSVTNPKVASPIYAAVGRGIAIIRFAILPSPTTSTATLDDEKWLELCSTSISPEDDTKPPNHDTAHLITLKIWARESLLNLQILVTQLTLSINQTICEYSLEKHFLCKSIRVAHLDEDLLLPWRKLLSQVRTLSVPSITETRVPLSLPSWAITAFVSELVDIMVELNPKWSPVIAFCENVVKPAPYVVHDTKSESETVSSILINKDQYMLAILTGLSFQEIATTAPKDEIATAKDLETINDSMLYPHMLLDRDDNTTQIVHRHCVVLILLSGEEITIYTYNWSASKLEQFNLFLNRLKHWTLMRQHLLKNILHQKLGLFYHTPPMSSLSVGSRTLQGTDVVKFNLENIDLLLQHASPNRKSANPLESPVTSGGTKATQSSSRDSKNRKPPSLTQNFDQVLLHGSPAEPMQTKDVMDPVLQHGNQFKAVALYNARTAEQQSILQSIYASWAGLFSQSIQSSIKTHHSPSFHLQAILKASRLLCCFRIPFIMEKQINRTLDNDNLDFYFTRAPPPSKEHGWFKPLLEAFFQEYKVYLGSLGFHQVVFTDSTPQSPPQQDTPTSFADSKDHYFQRILRGGSLLIRLSFEDPFVSCDLFAFQGSRPRLSASTNSLSPKDQHTYNRQITKLFVEECGKLKELMHTHSFLYDFHLQQTHDYLYPADKIASKQQAPFATAPLELIQLLRAILQYHPIPPQHARNCIFTRTLIVDFDPITQAAELFSYIAANSTKYSVQSAEQLGIAPALLLSSPVNAEGGDSWAAMAFIVAASSGKAGKMEIQYMALYIPASKTVVPSPLMLGPQHEPDSHQIAASEARQEKIQQTGDSINVMLMELVAQASQHYKRDLLWKKLMSSSVTDVLLHYEQFQALLKLVRCRLIQDVDPSAPLQTLTKLQVPWHALLNHLVTTFAKNARVIPATKGKHVVLLSPSNTNVFVYLCLEEGDKLTIFSCIRPTEATETQQELNDECQHISQTVNHMAYWIWKSQFIK